MTIKRTVEIECPRCGSKGKTVIWNSINVNLDPQAKEELLAGKLNLFNCSTCGLEDSVPVNLLYHDMNNGFCVQFVPFQKIERENFSSEFATDARLNLQRTGVENPPDYFRNVQ